MTTAVRNAGRVAVIGGGIHGCVAALLLAGRGVRVALYERQDTLWGGASANNEGKVHLGPVFALADRATHELMLRSATSFASIIDEAVGARLPWDRYVGDAFEYLVMPDGLRGADDLAATYRRINSIVTEAVPYLGRTIDRVVDPVVRRDPDTGLPVFFTEERAVDVRELGATVVAAVEAHPSIEVITGTAVIALRPTDDGVELQIGEHVERVAAAINCSWDQRFAVARGDDQMFNFRYKAAVRLVPWSSARTVTLVQGPYGDVVRHDSHVYISWYPDARLSNELGRAPSRSALTRATAAAADDSLANRQIDALRTRGLLPRSVEIIERMGGFIVGHGALDIQSEDSLLHSRSEFRTVRDGMIFTPLSFKLTSAPLSARNVVDEVLRAL